MPTAIIMLSTYNAAFCMQRAGQDETEQVKSRGFRNVWPVKSMSGMPRVSRICVLTRIQLLNLCVGHFPMDLSLMRR